MALDFPSSPTVGQKFQPGRRWQFGTAWDSDDTSAILSNRLVNPAMQISQQWGDNAVTPAVAAGSGYPSDQWVAGWSFGSATVYAYGYPPGYGEGASTVGPFPGRASAIYSSTANPLGNGNYCHIYQPIEGYQMGDALWGTANAKPVVARFLCMSVSPGTYSATIMNAAQDRYCYVRFTIAAANTWEAFTVTFPGCTSGVWPADNTQWGFFCVNGAFTTPYVGGSPGVWGTGATMYTNSAFNAFQTAGGLFRVAQVGLYVDPFGTGVAPYWEFPDYATQERLCMRYWYRCYSMRGVFTGTTYTSSVGIKHPVPMRIPPTGTIVGTVNFYDGGATGVLLNLGNNRTNVESFEVDAVPMTAPSFTAFRMACQYMSGADNYIAVSARF